MGLRELKETAHQQFVRGKFAQCAHTYQQILRLAPRDPNLYVRHAEASKRAGDRQGAIASYRTAAELLLELGCASRARGALKAALELDPRDPFLQNDIARLEPHHEELSSSGLSGERDGLPLLPPLEPGLAPVPPRVAPRVMRATRHEELLRTPALPPIHRALPSAPSVPPLGPPVLLPAPRARTAASGTPSPASASGPERLGTNLAHAATFTPPRSAPLGYRAPAARPATAALPTRSGTTGHPPPVLHPMATPSLPPRSATRGSHVQAPRTPAPPVLMPQPVTTGIQASASVVQASNHGAVASGRVAVPPPPPAEALIEAARELPLEQSSGPRLEVRRLSMSTLAFRCSPNDGWAVIRSHTPLEMHLVEDLEKLPPL
ncbi:hypothetical protein, partial [Hyalangium sp.]|uniref:hypothetical protein n=1 Tax=Hyalangium sp. TaxID=2028555 RepID=UPI002D739F91